MERLSSARSECEWDLADTCLERYQPIVQSIAENISHATDEFTIALEKEHSTPHLTNDGVNMDSLESTFTPLNDGSLQVDWMNEYFWLDDLFPLAN